MWILVVASYFLIALFAYSLCVAAGRADRREGRE